MRRTLAACVALIIAGLGIAAFAYSTEPTRTADVWLAIWLASWATAMGALTVLFLATLSNGEWIVPMRRVVEATAASLGASCIALVPVLALRHDLALDARAASAMIAPLLVGEWFLRASAAQDRERSSHALSLTRASALGLVVVFAATTVGAFDWIGSLHPRWMSNALGLELLAGGVASALGVTAIIVATRRLLGRLPEVSVEHLHTLARAVFVSVCAWMYLSFSPFLVVWMSDLPAAVSWYGPRVTGAWWGAALALVVLRFALPFVLLLVDPLRRLAPVVLAMALLLVLTEPLSLAWMILPSASPGRLSFRWTDLGVLVSCVSLCVAVALVRMRDTSSLPHGDPALARASAYRAR